MSPAASAVLRRIQEGPIKPTGLLTSFKAAFTYSDIQDALSDLLESGDVVLTPGLILQSAGSPETNEER